MSYFFLIFEEVLRDIGNKKTRRVFEPFATRRTLMRSSPTHDSERMIRNSKKPGGFFSSPGFTTPHNSKNAEMFFSSSQF